MKPFKHEIQKKKWDKLRKRKLITGIAIGGCSALAFAGIGVGVGYVVWNNSKTPSNPDEPTPVPKKALGSVITNRTLGTLTNDDNTTILNALQVANQSLNTQWVYLDSVASNSATVASKDAYGYAGTVDITFSIEPTPSPSPILFAQLYGNISVGTDPSGAGTPTAWIELQYVNHTPNPSDCENFSGVFSDGSSTTWNGLEFTRQAWSFNPTYDPTSICLLLIGVPTSTGTTNLTITDETLDISAIVPITISSSTSQFSGYQHGILQDNITYTGGGDEPYVQLSSTSISVNNQTFQQIGEIPGGQNWDGSQLEFSGTTTSGGIISGTTDSDGKIYFTGKANNGAQGFVCIKINGLIAKVFLQVQHVEPPIPPTPVQPTLSASLQGEIVVGRDPSGGASSTPTAWIELQYTHFEPNSQQPHSISGKFSNNTNTWNDLTFTNQSWSFNPSYDSSAVCVLLTGAPTMAGTTDLTITDDLLHINTTLSITIDIHNVTASIDGKLFSNAPNMHRTIKLTTTNGANIQQSNLSTPVANGFVFGTWNYDANGDYAWITIAMDSNAMPQSGSYDIQIASVDNNFIPTNVNVQVIENGFITIGKQTINEKAKYKVSAGNNVYYSSYKTTLGHDLINLKELSDDNGGITEFCVDDTINYGFLVDPSMNCHLYGTANASIELDSIDGNAVGVFVGKKESTSGIYNGNMTIDPNLSFDISSSTTAYGVRFNSTDLNSSQTIHGTFNVSSTSGTACGVYFSSTTADNSTQNIDGTFAVTSLNNSAYGVWFHDDTDGSSNIDGTFSVVGSDFASGVRFENTTSGSIAINGTFSISVTSSSSDEVAPKAYGVRFDKTASGSTQNISGTFTIKNSSGNSYGVYFLADALGSTTIVGTFAIFASNKAYGINFNAAAGGTFTMTTSKFFSDKVESGNIFQKKSGWIGSYAWNGSTVHASGQTNDSAADAYLTPETIYDETNANDSHFNILIIGNCGPNTPFSSSKTTFNGIYKSALDTYIKSASCPTTAKPWLEKIYSKISN